MFKSNFGFSLVSVHASLQIQQASVQALGLSVSFDQTDRSLSDSQVVTSNRFYDLLKAEI